MPDDACVFAAPDTYPPESAGFVPDPVAVLRELREAGRSYECEDLQGVRRYLLTHYGDASVFLRDEGQSLDVRKLLPDDPRPLRVTPRS